MIRSLFQKKEGGPWRVGVFLWIVVGMIAGAAARHFLPGRAPAGTMVMYLLGIVGAIVGGSIGTRVGFGGVNDVESWSLLVAIGGAVIVLAGHRLIARVTSVRGAMNKSVTGDIQFVTVRSSAI